MMAKRGWIGVDLDGTLAHYDGYKGPGHIGEPIQPMLARVNQWLMQNKQVRLFTARASSSHPQEFRDAFMRAWITWSLKHLGLILPVTAEKDMYLDELWDDKAVQVVRNTGARADGLDD
jgi:hypothetical protein